MFHPTAYQLNLLCYAWIGLALIVFISLFFTNAPYGKYIRKGWGPQLPNKWGWVIMEMVSPLALSFFFWYPHSIKNNSQIFIYSLWIFHYVYRSFIFPLKTATNDKTIPWSIVLMAVFFNSINGFTNGYALSHFSEHLQGNYLYEPHAILGLILFITGFCIHYYADDILIKLRSKKGPGYHIPTGFLYEYISSPNYFGELIQWTGFALLCWNLPSLVFVIWTAANLLPRAISNHKWYHNHFPDYPKNRKAIFPFVL